MSSEAFAANVSLQKALRAAILVGHFGCVRVHPMCWQLYRHGDDVPVFI